jgi:hypothetical protein
MVKNKKTTGRKITRLLFMDILIETGTFFWIRLINLTYLMYHKTDNSTFFMKYYQIV